MATNGSFAQQDQLKPSVDTDANNNLSKDEVGWYFVEQYYTTLSKSPEKLHLFYSKRSQFVYGIEAEVATVSVGRQDIQDRIKALDFQDCKVRVSNVDSQASNESIVIQVIGETSNKGGEPKKFVQTFVLAQQPSGYFVLNDMLRYIDEETEEEEHDAAPDAEAATEETAAPAEKAVEETTPEPVVEEAPVEAEPAAEEAVAAEEPAAAAVAEVAEEVEKPNEASAPAAAPAVAPAAPAKPAEPAAPPKPMSWASRAAAAVGPRPVVPLPKTETPPAATQARAPAPAAAPAKEAAAASETPKEASKEASKEAPTETVKDNKESTGWQTAGADSKHKKIPQAAATTEKDITMGYVKYVTEKVQDADLRAALAAHGELSYFDINRQKNCAFVEYKTLEAYQTAIASNPHTVNGENIVVEPRRPKAAYANGNFSGATRGNGASRGRGGFEGNRANGQGRGNATGQKSTRGNAARARGGKEGTTA